MDLAKVIEVIGKRPEWLVGSAGWISRGKVREIAGLFVSGCLEPSEWTAILAEARSVQKSEYRRDGVSSPAGWIVNEARRRAGKNS